MLLGGAAAACPAWATHRPPVLRFGYFDQYEPLSGPGPQGSARGLLVQLVGLVAQQAGLSADHHAYPWRRAQAMVAQGTLDGFCTTATPEREAYARFTREPLLNVRYLAFHRRDDARVPAIRRREDLLALRLGAFRGSGYVDAHLAPERVHYDDSIESVLRRIALNDLDVLVAGELPTWHVLQRLALRERLTATALPFLPPAAFRLGLRRSLPRSAEWLAQLDQAAQALRAQGALDALAAVYRPPA